MRTPLLLAFLLENPSNSELWELPEDVEILLRNPQWVIKEIGIRAYGRTVTASSGVEKSEMND